MRTFGLAPTVSLKPEQLGCLKAILFGVDCAAILPTGYGKSWIMQLLPLLFDFLWLQRDGGDPGRRKHHGRKHHGSRSIVSASVR